MKTPRFENQSDYENYIFHLESLLNEVKELCDWIINGESISGKVESRAFEIAHHPFILNTYQIRSER